MIIIICSSLSAFAFQSNYFFPVW